ncbi:hypothetical protein NXS19_013134 [Fusarium pseudograminearum]|nr:hypothetical protein NXS19_013134 [Fusarium pseudograminearum]
MLPFAILTAFLISLTTAKKHHGTTAKPCPTVISTKEVCTTCVTPACITFSTISLSQQDCPLTSQPSRLPSPAQSPSVPAAAIRRTSTRPLTDQPPLLSVQLLPRQKLSARIVLGLCA